MIMQTTLPYEYIPVRGGFAELTDTFFFLCDAGAHVCDAFESDQGRRHRCRRKPDERGEPQMRTQQTDQMPQYHDLEFLRQMHS